MKKDENILGQKFGKLEVLEPHVYTTKKGDKKRGYLCKCDCGNFKVAERHSLISGHIRSCGCLIGEFNRATKMGNDYWKYKKGNKTCKTSYKNSPKYKRLNSIWKNMKSRCNSKTSTSYRLYGARGIAVCDEWLTFDNFYNWAINNGYDDYLSLDRINNDGNYEPSNCRWATDIEQSRNKRNNHNITINGITRCITEWEELLGASCHRILKYIPQDVG